MQGGRQITRVCFRSDENEMSREGKTPPSRFGLYIPLRYFGPAPNFRV